MRNSLMNRLIAALAVAVLASFAADAALAQHSMKQSLDNLVVWRDGLASSAQPGREDFQKVKDQGYQMVINLAPPQSQGSVDIEGSLVASRGLAYVNIQVDFRNPTAANFKLFSDVVKAGAGWKILVHCQVNMRASSFSFLYRVIHEGAPVNDAVAKLSGVWSPDPVWKKFIEETLAASGRKVELL